MSKQTAAVNKTVVFGRDQFLSAVPALEIVDVPVPEFGEGVVVRVKGMSAGERDRFEESLKRGKGKNLTVDLRNFRARLCVASIVDEHGVKVFTSADLPALSAYPVKVLQRICNAAIEASGLNDEDEGDDPLDDSDETTPSDSVSA
jgi:hypothetical protein